MFKRAPDPHAEAMAEIDRWGAWFVQAHTLRLSRHECGDAGTPLAAAELAPITAQAAAIVARLKDDYFARQPR